MKHMFRLSLLALFLTAFSSGKAADRIEFTNGATLSGRVVGIHKQAREVEFEATIAGKTTIQRYPYDRIHQVHWNEKQYTVTPKTTAGSLSTATPRQPRSAEEVQDLIERIGSSPPTWLKTTPLEHPPTLDLNWPHPAPKPWNNRKNLGQYIWDRINPNANRWRSGIRLMYHLQSLHKNNPSTLRRVNESLAAMYFRFFQDYPRAAYWWQKLKVGKGSRDAIGLAECYYRLGNKQLALKLLEGRSISVGKIKLLGEVGEIDRSVQLANQAGPRSSQPHEIYLTAGDVCRLNRRYEEAIGFYQKVLSAPPARNEAYSKRFRGRANDSIEAIKRFELLDIQALPNGIYRGTSLGYEAPIEVRATVKAGRVETVEITQHREKQYYSALRDIPQQIISKQSVRNIDATSRATITAVAIINATAKALTDGPVKE